MPNVTLNGYYVHTNLSSHSHFNILVTKEGDVAEFSLQNLNNTASSCNLHVNVDKQEAPTDVINDRSLRPAPLSYCCYACQAFCLYISYVPYDNGGRFTAQNSYSPPPVKNLFFFLQLDVSASLKSRFFQGCAYVQDL